MKLFSEKNIVFPVSDYTDRLYGCSLFVTLVKSSLVGNRVKYERRGAEHGGSCQGGGAVLCVDL